MNMSAGQYSGMVDCLAQTAKVRAQVRVWLSNALLLSLSLKHNSAVVLTHTYTFFVRPQNEGPLALYKGFIPTLVRQMPYVIVTWVTAEQVKLLLSPREAKGVSHL